MDDKKEADAKKKAGLSSKVDGTKKVVDDSEKEKEKEKEEKVNKDEIHPKLDITKLIQKETEAEKRLNDVNE